MRSVTRIWGFSKIGSIFPKKDSQPCAYYPFSLNEKKFFLFDRNTIINYLDPMLRFLLVLVLPILPGILLAQIDTSGFNPLEEVVITGTKTPKRKTDSPVIVNVLNSKTLTNLQACNLSEGLKFQPGLRVETDCQTCNYTQLRMNGLQGGYSQILVNGRPIFSPMMSMYGLEQMPINMIDRIEVVRGGGSSLYGSSAIGGTVNVLTKLPQSNSMELNTSYHLIGGEADDYQVSANAVGVNSAKTAGVSFFFNKRDRTFFDANGDLYSELPQINSRSMGLHAYFKPSARQKLELSWSSLYEYRIGGEMREGPAHLSGQSEERTHAIGMGSLDYQFNFNQERSSLIVYAAAQQTDRSHYTGVFPDSLPEIQAHLSNPPYGTAVGATLHAGAQLNHRLSAPSKQRSVVTLGLDYLSERVDDQIPAYQYRVQQATRNAAVFVQHDWDLSSRLNLLSGIRLDQHNFLDRLIANPRAALLYKSGKNLQFRLNYGTGFRAPQAFDTDLHLAFAAGGVSRVRLASDLGAERAHSWSGSVNYDRYEDKWALGYTLEGFRTRLVDVFVLESLGEDAFGILFEKRNDQAALVQGMTVEGRLNYNRKIQVEGGFTYQKSEYEASVAYIENLEPIRPFLRTPNAYGFANINIGPIRSFRANVNYVFTGPMLLAHFAGAGQIPSDRYVWSRSFSELNTRISYTLSPAKLGVDLEVYLGVKNLLNAYQSDFDLGKNRDSNYIYGPAMPRTYFVGLRLNTGT